MANQKKNNYLAKFGEHANYLRRAQNYLNQFMQYQPHGAPGNVGNMTRFALNAIPFVGDAMALDAAKQSYQQGNYGEAAFNAATALPAIGDLGIAAKVGLPALAGAGGLIAGMMREGKDVPTGMSRQSGVIGSKAGFMDIPLFHGMAGDLEGGGFDLSKGNRVSHSPVGNLGVSVALDPETASEFARLASRTGSEKQGEVIVPLIHRAKNPTSLTLEGNETNLEMAATIQGAWDDGYDSIMIKNYTTPAGKKGVNFIIVKDPSQLRSPGARFDPSKKHSRNILAGAAGSGIVYGISQQPRKE